MRYVCAGFLALLALSCSPHSLKDGETDPSETDAADGDGGDSTSPCGNGEVDEGEECDDGNRVDGDGCDGDCTFSCTQDDDCDDGRGCTRDACDTGTHACGHWTMASGTTCREAEGPCDAPEYCDGSAADCPADLPEAAGRVCRPAAGACDPGETCDGSSPVCPDDALHPAGFTCRGAADVCDEPETCGGSAPDCPGDVMVLVGTVCRAAGGVCDLAETCTGTAPACPADALQPSTKTCRLLTGGCDAEETCSGTAADCPPDALRGAGVTCRNQSGPCDLAETCSGTSTDCPADAFRPSGAACDDGDFCSWPDACDGGGRCAGTPVVEIRYAAKVSAGGTHTCALLSGGALRCWGDNTYGELGDGTTGQRSSPVPVVGFSAGGSAAVSAGFTFSCALTAAGGVKCWGNNASGELGNGTTTARATPSAVAGIGGGASAVSAGYAHACALLSTGAVRCWGGNASGQVGDGSTTNRSSPVTVGGFTSGATGIATGASHSCALTNVRSVKCWGGNGAGQLGDGSTSQRTSPVSVAGLSSGVAAISASGATTCALLVAGGVKCWGSNEFGQVGDGGSANRTSPVNVAGLTAGVAAVAAGFQHSCALTTAGGVKCWGRNFYGQLGDGTATSSPTPVQTAGLASGAAAAAAGGFHTCALLAGGVVKCWGYNFLGQLGDGTTADRVTPATVACR